MLGLLRQPGGSRACSRYKKSGTCGKLPVDPTQMFPALAETLLAMVCIVGQHARRMGGVALLWNLVFWLALLDLTLLLMTH